MRFLLSFLFSAGLVLAAVGPSVAGQASLPPGGKYKDCYGWMDHVSLVNVRVHCTNGRPADMSFLSWPKFVDLPGGKTVQSKDLLPRTHVHVIFSQSLGLRHAYKVFVTGCPHGHGCYGMKI